jgi:hypothetical protein
MGDPLYVMKIFEIGGSWLLNRIRIEAIKGGIGEFNMSYVSVGKILSFR